MENSPPILKLKITFIEKVFNTLGFVSFAGVIFYIIFTWRSIPSQIPGHYNASGEVTRWGGREELFIPLAIGLLLWIGMTILERFPHLFNYRNLTEANVKDQYINSRMLVNLLKNEIAILFPFIITLNSIRVAKGFPSYMNTWSLLFIILLFAGTITLFIIRSQQLKKKSANETE